MNYQKILEDIYKKIEPELNRGKVADYIPALANVPKEQFAMTITLNPNFTLEITKSA